MKINIGVYNHMYDILNCVSEIFHKKEKKIPNPPYSYEFLLNLEEKEYPEYLKKLFEFKMGYKLNLKHPKTFNEKIQWLKLYDATPLKTQLTDKVLVRDWVKDKIGEKYLKPVLQVCKNFDEIDFNKLPEQFIIKANNGCKWHYRIKSKKEFLQTPVLYNLVKSNFDGWMNQEFFAWGGLELQYKNINPQILIEPLLIDKDKNYPVEIEVYCFNGSPRFTQKIEYSNPPISCVYTGIHRPAKLCFRAKYQHFYEPPDDNLKKAVELSRILAKDFILVRVDWLIFNNQIFFNEMTFTPFSGFNNFPKKDTDSFLGSFINLDTI